VTKKLTWEVDKTSLVLKVTDGAKETTWKLRKNMKTESLRMTLEEMQLALWEPKGLSDVEELLRLAKRNAEEFEAKPLLETARTVDAEELAELQRYRHYETSEEESRAAQAAEVARLNISAKWFDVDDSETYAMPIPDYDSGEVRPR
jgi:hypothetical protein